MVQAALNNQHNNVREDQNESTHPNDELENILPEDLTDHPAILAFQAAQRSFIVTNPRLPGNPIVYASPGFLELTGYPIERVLGRNCRFLQGPETDPAAVARLREAVDNGRGVNVTMLNYRQDGSTFWNRISIASVRDAKEQVTYFLGIQHIQVSPLYAGEEEDVLSKPSIFIG